MTLNYTVIRDTREKEGWHFRKTDRCSGTTDQKLDTGDYSLVGYEKILCIERKGSIAEFAHNILETRFDAELQRMLTFKYPFLLLEFDMDDVIKYPYTTDIPKYKLKRIKITGTFILKRLLEYYIKYPQIKIILCGNHAKDIATSIFKRIVDNENKNI